MSFVRPQTDAGLLLLGLRVERIRGGFVGPIEGFTEIYPFLSATNTIRDKGKVMVIKASRPWYFRPFRLYPFSG